MNLGGKTLSYATRTAVAISVAGYLWGAGGLLATILPAKSYAHSGYDSASNGSEAEETPKELKDVGIDDRLGQSIGLDIPFKDESGADVTLASIMNGRKPVLLSLAYFGCPSLCSYHLNGLNDAFKRMQEPLGREFDFVLVSIDPRENSELAAQKREAYVKEYGRPEGKNGWHFLTGTEENIKKLAAQVGFKYRWDQEQAQWAHASAAYAITPEGRISRYFPGIVFDPKVLRLSMIEASNGAIGSIVDKLTLFCFHFDPKENKYTVAAFNVMRAGGGITLLALTAILAPFWIRSRRERRQSGGFHLASTAGTSNLAPTASTSNNGVQGE